MLSFAARKRAGGLLNLCGHVSGRIVVQISGRTRISAQKRANKDPVSVVEANRRLLGVGGGFVADVRFFAAENAEFGRAGTLTITSAFDTMFLQRPARTSFTAQAKANGELVGLDFDPFLSGQDPCERYRVGKVSYQQNAYLADVYPVCNGKLSDSASVVIELQSTGSSWRFVNFRYPRSHTDLIEELRLLREQRLKK